MRRLTMFIIFVGILCQSVCANAQQIVNVGGYEFPPFVELAGEQISGLTLDLIEALNRYQQTYRFQFLLTSSKRRYLDFERDKFDLIMFESLEWGWTGKPVAASRVYLKGGEVYITKADGQKDQSYFDSFAGKSLVGYLGYHYGFAQFNADQAFLEKQFNMTLTTSHSINIWLILSGAKDIAVVTDTFLDRYLLEHPENKAMLLISDKRDQIYQHTILVRQNATPTIAEVNAMLTGIEQAGILAELWKKYGIK